jgi:FKBP-type peptidyl-prolyl cis-trans isomerase
MRTRTALQLGLLLGGGYGILAYSAHSHVIVGATAPAAAVTTIIAPQQSARPPATTAPAGRETTLPSGLKIVTLHKGSGPRPSKGQLVVVHYTGLLPDGKKFDSSRDRGEPFEFPVGEGVVIRGWDEGIARLHVGERARLIIPPNLGYGAAGAPPTIPPDADLIFDVELIAIKGDETP